jgi:hypothetical protein
VEKIFTPHMFKNTEEIYEFSKFTTLAAENLYKGNNGLKGPSIRDLERLEQTRHTYTKCVEELKTATE